MLSVARGDLSTPEALAQAQIIAQMAFNPWNTTDEFRPLGNLNRARKAVYDASSAHRLGYRWETQLPVRNVLIGVAVRKTFEVINRYVPWHRLPVRLGLLNLEAFRQVLRNRNLFDSQPREAPPRARPVPPAPPAEQARVTRTFDGTANDLSAPAMGSVGTAFGRNLRPDYRPDLFEEPNPVIVSQQLLHREQFLPALSLNLVAAAWIQFQVHDWVGHPRYPLGKDDVHVALPRGMTWSNTPEGPPEHEMRIAGNIPFPDDRPNPMGPVFPNNTTPWWDGSEVYGADAAKSGQLRDGPKLRLTPDGYLPTDANGFEITGFNESWWLGLGGLHTLFAREHNLLCDELRAHYRDWGDEQVYQTARLIVSALIAKIHTVEWTPAILGTEIIDTGLKSNWYGPPAHDWLYQLGLWLVDSHARVGIPKTMPDHSGVPYSLTEDFVTVYRMHPLLPDDYRFADHRTGEALGSRSFARHPGREGRWGAARLRPGEHALLLRPVPPGCNHPAQLPALAAEVRAQRRGDRPVGGGPGAHPPPRRAPLQRFPGRAAQATDQALGTAVRQPGVGAADEGHLPQRRRGRHDGGPVRGDAPGGLRVLRHRLPHLHPDGIAAAAKRPLPHRRLPPGDLLAIRHGLDR